MPKVPAGYVELRRNEIIGGARTCFARQGYRGTTVTDLEAATGLTRGTIFRYFSSKAEILAAVGRDEEVRLRQGYEDRAARESLDFRDLRGFLHGIFAQQLTNARRDPSAVRMRLELMSLAEVDEDIAALVERTEADRHQWRRHLVAMGAEAGLFDGGWDLDTVTDVLSTVVLGLSVDVSFGFPRALSDEQLVEELTTAALAILGHPVPAP